MQKNKINKIYLMSNEIAVLEILVGLDKNDWKILESTNIKFYVHVFFFHSCPIIFVLSHYTQTSNFITT